MDPDRRSYAQNWEDIILSGFFTDVKNGFYVDVGANDSVRDSVTKYFYDRGWHGINIEPIPLYFNKLQKDRPRDINLQIGIGSQKTKTAFHYYPVGDGLSTLSPEMAHEHKKQRLSVTEKEEVSRIDVLPLSEVLEKHAKSKTIHFMKIDVEGFEGEVIKGNDWSKFRPQVLCIEANHIFSDWDSLLADQNYKKFFNDGLNNYYVASEAYERAKNFSYVETIINRKPLHYLVYDEIASSKNKIAMDESELNRLRVLLRVDDERIIELEDELGRPRSFKESFRIFAGATHRMNRRLIEKLKPIARADNIIKSQQDPKKLLAAIQVYDKENEELVNTAFSFRMLPYEVVSCLYELLYLFLRKLENINRTMPHKKRGTG